MFLKIKKISSHNSAASFVFKTENHTNENKMKIKKKCQYNKLADKTHKFCSTGIPTRKCYALILSNCYVECQQHNNVIFIILTEKHERIFDIKQITY